MLIEAGSLGVYRLTRPISATPLWEGYEARLLRRAGVDSRRTVRMLREPARADADIVDAFLGGARRGHEVDHPSLLTIDAYGRANGIPFVAMDHVDGWSLSQLIQSSRVRGQRLPPPAAVLIAAEVARALHHLHTRLPTMTHGALTLDNVYVERIGAVRMGPPFFCAMPQRFPPATRQLLEPLLPYMAPEQATGGPASPQSDIYAAGLLLFELLTGCRFNEATHSADMWQQAQNPPGILPSHVVDGLEALDEVVEGALRRNAAKRTSSAEALRRQLEQFLGRSPFDRDDLARLCQQLLENDGDNTVGAHDTDAPTAREESPTQAVTIPRLPAAPPARQPELADIRPEPLTVHQVVARADATAQNWVRPTLGILVFCGLLLTLGLLARARSAMTEPTTVQPVTELERSLRPREDTSAQLKELALRKAPPSSATQHAEDPMLEHPPREARDSAARARAAPSRMQGKEIRQLLREAEARGLLAGDDPTFDWLRERVQQRGLSNERVSALRRLRAYVEDFTVDPPFVLRKLRRLKRCIHRTSGDSARAELNSAHQEAQSLVMQDRLTEASRQISDAYRHCR